MSIEAGPISPIRLMQILAAMGVRTGTTVISGAMATLAGVAVPLTPLAIPCLSVTIKALRTNGNYVYIGGVGVTALTGFQLWQNESVTISIDFLNKVYMDVAVGGEGVTYIAVV